MRGSRYRACLNFDNVLNFIRTLHKFSKNSNQLANKVICDLNGQVLTDMGWDIYYIEVGTIIQMFNLIINASLISDCFIIFIYPVK